MRAISSAIRQRFAENFTRQGSGAGAWASLRPRTISERRRLGYAGAHPILVRSGRYRASFTEEGASDHFSEFRRVGSYWMISEGSDDERGPELEIGVPSRNLPPRPVTLLDDTQEARIGDVVDYIMLQIEAEVIR